MEQYHAKTLKGLEELLAAELEDIGAENIKLVNRGVNFTGSTAMMYKANLYLRTALRILKPIAQFSARNEDELYRKIRKIRWSDYMHYKNSFAIDAVSFSDTFKNSHYLELKAKDAIVDQFREKTSLRPSVDKRQPEIRLNIHVNQQNILISLDSSGESLHKRGYRKHLHEASLSEVLAAGLLMLAGFKGERPFVNPMCGSGTIIVEAAMIASGMLPGITGRKYGFEFWPDFDDLLYKRIREQMPEPHAPKHSLSASDVDQEAIRITKANLRNRALDKVVKVKRHDFKLSREETEPSLVIMNPPYGERLEV